MNDECFESLVSLWREHKIDRRQLLTQAAALGVSAAAAQGVIAARGAAGGTRPGRECAPDRAGE